MKKLFFCLAAIVAAGTTATAQETALVGKTTTGINAKAVAEKNSIPDIIKVYGSGGRTKDPDGNTCVCPNSSSDLCAEIEESISSGKLEAGELVRVFPANEIPFSAVVIHALYYGDMLFGKNLLLAVTEDGDGISKKK